MPRLRAVLLDADHTLLDTDRSERVALRRALLGLGVPYSRALLARYREINLEFWARYRRGEIGPEDLARERFCALLVAAGRDAGGGGALGKAYLEELAKTGHVRPWSRPVLTWIRARFRTGLVTNGIDWVQRARVTASGLGTELDVVVTSDGCGYRKPDPRIVHEALTALGVSPEEAVLVGDDASADGGAARAAGVRFCWLRAPGYRASPGRAPGYRASPGRAPGDRASAGRAPGFRAFPGRRGAVRDEEPRPFCEIGSLRGLPAVLRPL